MNKTLKTEGKDFVVAIDTDSIYLTMETLVEKVCAGKTDEQKIKFMDKICEDVFQPFIDDGYQELAQYMNAYAQKMQMKREVLADKAIWTAKKRYILNVHNSEGVQYAKPKLKVMGLEMVKSSTPAVCRNKMRECLKIILDKDEESVIDFIEAFRNEFSKFPVEDISFPRGVNGIEKNADAATIFAKGTPIHCKGALVYNHVLKEKKLTKKYPTIKDGDKIKFIHLKQPNPYRNNTIAFLNVLPKELDLHEYIDYDKQFDAAFLEPMKTILNCIGWKAEPVNDLSSFFT